MRVEEFDNSSPSTGVLEAAEKSHQSRAEVRRGKISSHLDTGQSAKSNTRSKLETRHNHSEPEVRGEILGNLDIGQGVDLGMTGKSGIRYETEATGISPGSIEVRCPGSTWAKLSFR